MKLIVILMTVFTIQSFAASGQSQKFNISLEQATIEEVLDVIEKESDFYFFFKGNESELSNSNFNVNFRNSSLQEILGFLLKDTKFSFKVIDNYVAIAPKELVAQQSNERVVKGTVTDKNSQPLPGATVVVKGTTQGTVTNADGEYTMENVPEDATLVFSFVGMLTKEVEVGSQTSIDITMQADAVALDEVVAVGYGVLPKSDLTGSVGSIKAEEISKQPVVSVDQALQGRISGVQVSSISGAPGSGSSIRIRGGNSISAGNEPLYVIDGFIGGGDLSTINPNDIESIEVLKDASATAIYGSRGSNGVILITTKRGTEGEDFGVSFDSYMGIQTPVNKIDLLNGPEFAEYRNEYAEFLGNSAPFPNINDVANTDWQEVLFRDVPMSDNTLSFYNNSASSNYYVSLNYLDQDGIKLGSGFDRYQLRFNFDQDFGDDYKVGASLNGSYSNRENPRAAAIGYFVLPTAPIYNDDGSFHRVDAINGSTYNNPVAQDKLKSDNTHKYRALGNIYLQVSPIEDLIVKSTFGFDITNDKRNRYNSVNLPTNYEAARGGQAFINTNFGTSIQNENTINYTTEIGNHDINILGGLTYQDYSTEGLDVSARGFTNDVTTYNAIETGDPEFLRGWSGENGWTLLSGLFRLNYSYASKYLFTVSGRQDGSSRLAKNNKWQFFPSAAVGWRLSEESFIDQLGIFSNLKLRASYGKTGSQSISPYSTLARLGSGTNYIGGQQVTTFIPSSFADPSLKWEVTDQYDLGLDAGFFNSRLNFEFDYYYKKTSDLLLARQLSYQTGFTSRLENIGSLQNQGVDITIRGIIIDNQDLSWSSDLTFSSNKSEVLKLSGGNEFIETGRGSRIILGEPVSTFFGAKFIGLWQEGDPGLGGVYVPGAMKFEDLNEDGEITALDGQIIGKGTPDFYGGLNNVISYKNFTLSAFFDFSYGNDIYDLDGRDFNTGHANNVYGKFRDRWTPTNTDTDVPRAGAQVMTYFNNYSGGQGNSYDVHDGSYLRLKTLNLQYQIPVESTLLKSLAVYGTATNLFTLTNYEGFSPDVNATGTHSTRRGFDSNTYPTAKVLLIGLKADF